MFGINWLHVEYKRNIKIIITLLFKLSMNLLKNSFKTHIAHTESVSHVILRLMLTRYFRLWTENSLYLHCFPVNLSFVMKNVTTPVITIARKKSMIANNNHNVTCIFDRLCISACLGRGIFDIVVLPSLVCSFVCSYVISYYSANSSSEFVCSALKLVLV